MIFELKVIKALSDDILVILKGLCTSSPKTRSPNTLITETLYKRIKIYH